MRVIKWQVAAFFALYSTGVMAQDANMILAQLGSAIPLIFTVSVLTGLGLIGWGLGCAYLRTKNPQQYTMGAVIRLNMAGILLLSFSTVFGVLTRSTVNPEWSGDYRSMLALSQSALDNFDAVSSNTVLSSLMPGSLGILMLGFLYLIGIFFFIYGLYTIKDIGQNGSSGPITTGKVITRVLAGLIAIHVTDFSCIVWATFSSNSAGFC